VAAIALALCASSLAGSGDFVAGLLSRRIPALTVLSGVFGVGILAYVAIAIATGEPVPSMDYLVLGFAAGTASGTALFLLYRALAIGPMSVVSPVSASAAVVPVVVGLTTGDKAHVLLVAGIALTIAGGVLVASRPSAMKVDWDRTLDAVGLAAGAAFLIGLNLVALHSAVRASPLWTAIASRSGGMVAIACVVVMRGNEIRPPGRAARWIVVVGLVNAAAMLAQVEALSLGSLSVVATLTSLYPVPTVCLALIALHESIRPAQMVGVAAVLAGVALLSVSR
jgi:drug/metabolite transporter (DMT)-like permease